MLRNSMGLRVQRGVPHSQDLPLVVRPGHASVKDSGELAYLAL